MIIDTYYSVYQNDIDDIKNFTIGKIYMTKKQLQEIDNHIKLKNSNFEFNNFDIKAEIEKLNEENIKNFVLNIIKYLDINPVDILDNIKNCGQTIDDVIRNINYTGINSDINIFVDADKSRFSLYPILLKMCSILFENLDNIPNINFNRSILDEYDSATMSSLKKMIENLKKKYSTKS